jgi:hypothetical protein
MHVRCILTPMKASTTLVFLSIVAGSGLIASAGAPQMDRPALPNRDLTLIADPSSFPPSPAEMTKVKIRVLKADQAAAVARIAAIDSRIRQIREDSEARIKALIEERDMLVAREKEISDTLKTPRP